MLMASDERLVCVHRVPDPIEANILRGLLEQAGVPVTLHGESLTGGYSGVPKVADVRVMVPARARAQAEAVIRDFQDRSTDSEASAWQCVHCGEENGGGFEICWSCGRAPED
jgi:hypothetical protein